MIDYLITPPPPPSGIWPRIPPPPPPLHTGVTPPPPRRSYMLIDNNNNCTQCPAVDLTADQLHALCENIILKNEICMHFSHNDTVVIMPLHLPVCGYVVSSHVRLTNSLHKSRICLSSISFPNEYRSLYYLLFCLFFVRLPKHVHARAHSARTWKIILSAVMDIRHIDKCKRFLYTDIERQSFIFAK